MTAPAAVARPASGHRGRIAGILRRCAPPDPAFEEALPRARRLVWLAAEIDRTERRLARLRGAAARTLDVALAIYVAHVVRGRSQRRVAAEFGVHYSTVSRICGAVEDAADSPEVRGRLDALAPGWDASEPVARAIIRPGGANEGGEGPEGAR